MGVSKLEKRVKGLRRMVIVLAMLVIAQGLALLIHQAKEWQPVKVKDLGLGVAITLDGMPAPTPESADPYRKWDGDAIAVASLSNYADVEATRIAKMAELMLGLGGMYSAECQAVYDSRIDKSWAEYRIEWTRPADAQGNTRMAQAWSGASWGECIGKMMAWRGGE